MWNLAEPENDDLQIADTCSTNPYSTVAAGQARGLSWPNYRSQCMKGQVHISGFHIRDRHDAAFHALMDLRGVDIQADTRPVDDGAHFTITGQVDFHSANW